MTLVMTTTTNAYGAVHSTAITIVH